MMRQTFYRPALVVINGQRASDHARQPVSVTSKRIETSNRMADGTLRKYYVATKHEFQISWDLLPHTSYYTVDGFMGTNELEAAYDQTFGAFDLILVSGQTATNGQTYAHQGRNYASKTYKVHFTDFSKEFVKRGQKFDMYNVSLSMEEI